MRWFEMLIPVHLANFSLAKNVTYITTQIVARRVISTLKSYALI